MMHILLNNFAFGEAFKDLGTTNVFDWNDKADQLNKIIKKTVFF